MTYIVAMPITKPERVAARVSKECGLLIVAIRERHGISLSGVIEMAVRALARAEGIDVRDALAAQAAQAEKGGE